MADKKGRKEDSPPEKETPQFTPPPETPPPLATPPPEDEGSRWPPLMPLLPFIALALVVAAIVVFGGRWIYRSTHHKPVPKPTPMQTNPNTSKKTPAQSATKTPATRPSPSTSSSPPSGTTAQGGQITNTGPGDVVATFVGVSAVAAGLHYVISLRRSNQTR